MTTCDPRRVDGRLFCMGQPDREDLKQLAEEGVRRVINLRPHSELNWDEAGYAESCGLEYVNIPVATPADLDRPHAEALRDALSDDARVLIHCGTSNRVGALLALVAAWHWGRTPEEALAIGKAAGLAALEPAVRVRLDLPMD